MAADHPHVRAESGGSGGKRGKTGAEGEDLVTVPDGTRIEDEHGLLADLVGEGSRAVVARGGAAGRGSASLATSRDRVPRGAEGGERGEEKRLAVELRIVADVGLVGLPNAGKSTLLASLTAAHQDRRLSSTTSAPNLGVAGRGRFVVADVPGLVEGAHEGKGLGHRFLRHVIRCRALVLVVDLSAPDPAADLGVVREELRGVRPVARIQTDLIVGTKLDLAPDVDVRRPSEPARSRSRRSRASGWMSFGDGSPRLREEAAEVAEERGAYVVLGRLARGSS